MLLLALPLLAAAQHPVAVLRSGDRVPCTATTAAGDFLVATPWGRLAGATDPVREVVDPADEIDLLQAVRTSDYPAWVRRLAARGLVGELVAEAGRAEPDPDRHELVLAALEGWGRRLDPVPARLAPDERIDWLWHELDRAEAGRAALLTGRLLAEIPAGNAPADRRVGLADLRRALRQGSPARRRAAAAVAAHQFEPDLLRPLAAVSLEEADASVQRAACAALLGIDEDRALGAWTLALLRGDDRAERARAAENLGRSASPKAVDSLMLAVASAARAPGRFVFFGRQVSLVTDVDVEVAQAAAIADPVVNVLTEGSVLEVRLVSTFTSRAAMRGLHRLTGANPGPGERDWLRWYEQRRNPAQEPGPSSRRIP